MPKLGEWQNVAFEGRAPGGIRARGGPPPKKRNPGNPQRSLTVVDKCMEAQTKPNIVMSNARTAENILCNC